MYQNPTRSQPVQSSGRMELLVLAGIVGHMVAAAYIIGTVVLDVLRNA